MQETREPAHQFATPAQHDAVKAILAALYKSRGL